jgi:hypothetical protein
MLYFSVDEPRKLHGSLIWTACICKLYLQTKNELPRSKLRGIKPPLAYSHGPASLAGWMLVYRVDVVYVLHAHLRTTPTGRLGDAVAYSLLHCPAASHIGA